MRKQVLISLLSVLPVVISCTTEVDDVVDQVQVDQGNDIEGNDVEDNDTGDVAAPLLDDNNPLELSESMLSQRNALLNMAGDSSDVNWDINLSMTEWENIVTDETTGNVVTLIADPFITLDEELNNLIFLKSLVCNEGTLPENNNIELPSLETLNVNRGHLTEIPDWVLNLENLNRLNYSDSKLQQIPSGINQLTSLQYLKVDDGTPLQFVSLRLADLTNLISIDFSLVSGVGLTAVPVEVCNLANEGVEVLLPAGVSCEE